MTPSWSAAPTAAESAVDAVPRPRPRRRAESRNRVTGGVLWIVVLAVLLAGIVAVNVAVLRLNVQLDRLGNEQVNLRAQNKELQSELSASLASPKIQELALQHLGLVPASPDTTRYVQLGPTRR